MLKHPIGLRSQLGQGQRLHHHAAGRGAARRCTLADAAAASRRATAGSAGFTMLVIDNEPAILEGMESLLGGWGCTRHPARRPPRGAWRLWQAGGDAIDLILADYHLDRDDGLGVIADAARRMRAARSRRSSSPPTARARCRIWPRRMTCNVCASRCGRRPCAPPSRHACLRDRRAE